MIAEMGLWTGFSMEFVTRVFPTHVELLILSLETSSSTQRMVLEVRMGVQAEALLGEVQREGTQLETEAVEALLTSPI